LFDSNRLIAVSFFNDYQHQPKNELSMLPFALLGRFLFAERRRLSTESRADDHRDAAAVDEVARHVDDDQDDDE